MSSSFLFCYMFRHSFFNLSWLYNSYIPQKSVFFFSLIALITSSSVFPYKFKFNYWVDLLRNELTENNFLTISRSTVWEVLYVCNERFWRYFGRFLRYQGWHLISLMVILLTGFGYSIRFMMSPTSDDILSGI